jgi:transcriptional regulator with XRE-family HTH domain
VSEARSELAAFLRRRREQLSPAAAGLTSQGPRRTPGLRREEVAMLAGVGLTWYTWLEQARDINVSRQVIDSLARTLRLTASEHEYVLRLAGYESPRRDGASWPVHGQRVLDAFGSSPAYAVAWDWTILAWNDAYAALYPTISQAPPSDRNLLWLVWTDPAVRDLLPDWETDSRRFVTMYRADIGPRLGSPQVAALVSRLRQRSAAFSAAWDSHDVDGFASRIRTFQHPTKGLLRLEQHQLVLADLPGLQIVVYTHTSSEGDE